MAKDSPKRSLTLTTIIILSISVVCLLSFVIVSVQFEAKGVIEILKEFLLLVFFIGSIHSLADYFIKRQLIDELVVEMTSWMGKTDNPLVKKIQGLQARYDQESELSKLPDDVQMEARDVLRCYVTAYNLRVKYESANPGFFNLAKMIQDRQMLVLKNLSEGRYRVSEGFMVEFYKDMANEFRDSFDAVSLKDTEFWTDPTQSKEYFNVGVKAARKGVKVTRTFLLHLKDLKDNESGVIQILKAHESRKLGWSIVILDELAGSRSFRDPSLDFALFNEGSAVSIFWKVPQRIFEVEFSVHSNQEIIKQYQKIHKELIAECCLMNERFFDNLSTRKEYVELLKPKRQPGIITGSTEIEQRVKQLLEEMA